MEQLTSPLYDYSSSKKSAPQSETGDSKTIADSPSDKTHELEVWALIINKSLLCTHFSFFLNYIAVMFLTCFSTNSGFPLQAMFIERNVASLQAMNAADVFIDTCLNLPHLARYCLKYQQAIYRKGFSLPTNVADAQLIRHR